MIYDIKKMHNQNAPGCSDCQLVTAVNAYIYFYDKKIEQDSDYYQYLVDLICAREGSALSIEKAHKELGVGIKKEYRRFSLYEEERAFPAELRIWHKRHGYHSACLIDYEPKTKAYRLLGLKYETTHGHWVFQENLYQWIKSCGLETSEVRVFEPIAKTVSDDQEKFSCSSKGIN